MFKEKIILLKKELINYAELVEKMVRKSMLGILERNEEILYDVINNDEPQSNQYELEFDESCINHIAQYQPIARNLRMVIIAMKMSNDLERMADHAVNIAQNGLVFIKEPLVKPLIDIPKMGDITSEMLKNSIESFVNEDAELAQKVCIKDNEVDLLKKKIIEDLKIIMEKNPTAISPSLKLISIAGNLERIADLTTNICEDVLYLAEGIVIKHQHQTQK